MLLLGLRDQLSNLQTKHNSKGIYSAIKKNFFGVKQNRVLKFYTYSIISEMRHVRCKTRIK